MRQFCAYTPPSPTYLSAQKGLLMANSTPKPTCDPKRFLRISIITVLLLVIASRLCYILYSATYYDTRVSDGLFSLIYHISNSVYAVSRGAMFAVILCGFFLWERSLLLHSSLIATGGLLVFHLSAYVTDLINGTIAGVESTTLVFLLLQILTEFILEFLILILILVLFFRKKRHAQAVSAPFSIKNPPQAAGILFIAIYFFEGLYNPIAAVSDYLSGGGALTFAVVLDFLATALGAAMTGFVIPYSVLMLFLCFFLPKNQKN